MTGVQKVIKYLALAFAFFLIFTIGVTIFSTLVGVSTIFSHNDVSGKTTAISLDSNIKELDIDVATASIEIKEDSKFYVEVNNEYIKTTRSGKTFKIRQKRRLFKFNKTPSVVVYIPSDYLMEKFSISSGAGKVKISNLKTEELELELGAGKVTIDNLTVLDKTVIDGGAGEMVINGIEINNLDLDMGVGNLALNSKLLGTTKIDAGIGNLKLELPSRNDYKIDIDSGIGNCQIDGQKINHDTIYGAGQNYIKLDGGVGNITINFNNTEVTDYKFLFEVKDYLTNSKGQLLVAGIIKYGSPKENDTVELLDSNGNLIKSTKIVNHESKISYDMDTKNNTWSLLMLSDVTEQDLKNTTKIVIK